MKKIITNSDIIRNKYKKYLKGKRVALVGPGWHTKNTKQHDLIESYDVVVRLNDGYILVNNFKEDLGSRTDIIYVSLSTYYFTHKIFTKKKLMKFKKDFKWISNNSANVHKSCALRLEKVDKKKRPPIYCVEKDVYDKLARKVGGKLLKKYSNDKKVYKKNKKKLSTGIVAIYDLLQHEIEELYVTGVSFYHKGVIRKNKQYRSGYSTRWATTSHNFPQELSVFIDLCREDKRLVYDNTLNDIMEFVKNKKE